MHQNLPLSFRDEKMPTPIDDDFALIDYYANIDPKASQKIIKPKSIFRRFISFVKNDVSMIVIYLALLGAVTSTASMAVDWSIDNVEKTREFISTRTSFYFFNFLLYTLYTLAFAFASVSVQYISKFSSGSGVPQMKSMIGGILMNRYLSFSTLAAKILGLISGYGAGLSIGKEGPFCHIAGCISHLIMKLPFFSKIRRNDVERRQMLAAACAAGVASVFGAPFGGVLFAIEITSTYFPVGNLWRSLFTALSSSLLFTVWRYFGIKGTHQFTEFEEHSFQPYEYLFFGLEGIVMGLLGAFFVAGSLFIIKYQNRMSLFKGKPFQTIAIFTLISSFFCFHLDPGLKGTTNRVLSYMYKLPLDQWNVPNPMLHLVIACIGKYFLTMTAVVMPIPAGVFTPVFITGAAIGRLFGETVSFFSKTFGLGTPNPLGYSVVGAAALASGVTRTLSTGVIMFELTGQIRFLIPTLIATVMALPVGNFFNRSFYSEMMDARGIPNPEITHLISLDPSKTAADLMRRTYTAFTKESTVKECNEILIKHSNEFYPILENKESKVLIGVVSHATMDQYLSKLDPEAPLLFQNSPHETKSTIPYDPAPFILMSNTSIERIRYLFGILSLSSALILENGQLIGVLHKRDLIKLM